VSDWLAAGGTVEQLVALCETAPLWVPVAEAADRTFVPHDIEDLDQCEILPRQWLLSTILCRRFVTVLAASGGSGKTTLLLAWALSLAVGRALIGCHVHKRPRVVILTFEGQRRRLLIAIEAEGMLPQISCGSPRRSAFLRSHRAVSIASRRNTACRNFSA
jgi:hypothetical protein